MERQYCEQITNIWNICDICFWLDADQPQMYMLSKPWLFGKGRFAVGIHEHQLVSSSKDGPGCRVLLSGLDLEDPFHQIARQNETKHHILCDLTGLPLRVGFNAPQWDRIDDMERYGTDPKLVMGCHTLPQ